MNLEDLLDENGLQQDEWSREAPTFGKEGQLTIVGWSGRDGGNKFYILKCSKCSKYSELFGKGYFKSLKGGLLRGIIPCGCSRKHHWSIEQYIILCSRKAEELGYTFLGFEGVWKGRNTKIKMLCEKHGEWNTTSIHNLLHIMNGCKRCGIESSIEFNTKSDDLMIQSFQDSGAFHPDTKFWRSERKNSEGYKKYWYMSCPECGETGESTSVGLQRGHIPCGCSIHRQQECYINWVIENEYPIAIKFGIANNSNIRIKQQSYKSTYTLKQHSIHIFPSVSDCKKAERDCRQELECGVVLKRDMRDGYTETTWVYNLEKIIEIYERNGGVLIV